MDDQRANRKGGVIRRFRISLRLMLLAVTLFCVLCACYRVHRVASLRAELAELRVRNADLKEESRESTEDRDPEWDLQIRDMDRRIAEINKELGTAHDDRK
jgi:hypothetical protein